MTDERDAIAEAIIASDEMDRKATYRSRGRHYAALSDAELNTRFAAAFKARIAANTDELGQIANDFHAELNLRGLDLLHNLIADDLKRFREKLNDFEQGDPEFDAMVDRQLDETNKPRN